MNASSKTLIKKHTPVEFRIIELDNIDNLPTHEIEEQMTPYGNDGWTVNAILPRLTKRMPYRLLLSRSAL